jgi:hypothetical protein
VMTFACVHLLLYQQLHLKLKKLANKQLLSGQAVQSVRAGGKDSPQIPPDGP